MPALTHLMRFSFGGPLFGLESWSCTINFNAAQSVQPDPDVVKSALTAFKDQLQGGAQIGWWKYNEVSSATGKYLFAESNTYELNPVLTSGSPAVPAQLAVVATFGTQFKRGPAHGGRIYIPASNTVGDNDGLVAVLVTQQRQTAVKTFLNTLTTAAAHTPIIWSPKSHIANNITSVGVGRVIDTQRRRRRNLKELTVPIAI